jgi:hypothetical protein
MRVQLDAVGVDRQRSPIRPRHLTDLNHNPETPDNADPTTDPTTDPSPKLRPPPCFQ